MKIKLVTNLEMKQIEEEAERCGLTIREIHQQAAESLSDIIETEYGYMAENGAIGLIGTNSKGEVAVHTLLQLAKEDWEVTAYLLPGHQPSEADVQLLQGQGCKVLRADQDSEYDQLKAALAQHAVWIDAVAPLDASLPLDKTARAILSVVKEVDASSPSAHHVVAIDCPSGIRPEEGQVSAEAVSAELTVALGAVNTGLLSSAVYPKIGELQTIEYPFLASSEIYQKLQSYIVDYDAVQEITPTLDEEGEKRSVCVLGGSIPQPGGVLLSARAALRAGAEKVTVAVPSTLFEVLAGQIPEASWLLLANDMGNLSADNAALFHKNMEQYACVYLGAGFSAGQPVKEFLIRLFETHTPAARQHIGFVQKVTAEETATAVCPPFVIDQDVFSSLIEIENWQKILPPSMLILEKKVLREMTGPEQEKSAPLSELDLVRSTAKTWQQVILLLGSPMLAAAPDGRVAAIKGPACTGRAGVSYLLGGLIAGLSACGVAPFEAASAGAWILQAAIRTGQGYSHSAAGMIASDIEAALTDVFQVF